ncbi:MAG: hypothetical protein ACI9QA_000013 [Methanobacteriota archaeon]|jgi:hypothetical protein|uniref:DUF5611 family protein n=1 Tax=Halorutilus salinus TaxID=2487751 RepID=A0A9Q4GGR2_9EURY|nr:DUF5611 family protein [Halorutilus salinus]MCX2818015.1 DUF5611 family protein [Halorutilus salinus]
MRYYKMRRGEYIDERVPDMREKVEEYFGGIGGTDDRDGVEMYVVKDTMVFDRVEVGVDERSNAKDRLAVHFEEKDVSTLQEEGLLDEAGPAREAKNSFLKDVTGRDAKSRRESMKRDVEPDEDVDV